MRSGAEELDALLELAHKGIGELLDRSARRSVYKSVKLGVEHIPACLRSFRRPLD